MRRQLGDTDSQGKEEIQSLKRIGSHGEPVGTMKVKEDGDLFVLPGSLQVVHPRYPQGVGLDLVVDEPGPCRVLETGAEAGFMEVPHVFHRQVHAGQAIQVPVILSPLGVEGGFKGLHVPPPVEHSLLDLLPVQALPLQLVPVALQLTLQTLFHPDEERVRHIETAAEVGDVAAVMQLETPFQLAPGRLQLFQNLMPAGVHHLPNLRAERNRTEILRNRIAPLGPDSGRECRACQGGPYESTP